MKTMNFLKIALLCVFTVFVYSCNNSDEIIDEMNEPLAILKVSQEDGVSVFATSNVCPILTATNPLTADEIEFLYAVREDEKLTKDLYTAFAAQYPAALQLSRIASAEATHIATIEALLAYYEINFPALGEAGKFADATRQTQYNEMLSKGITLQGAYEAMASLEEENVVVYTKVSTSAENVNIKLVISNMLRASTNHLKAAVRQLTFLGFTYTPSVLDQTSFDTIINSPFTQGNGYGQQKGKGNGGNTNSQKGNMGQGNKGNVNGTGACTGTANGTYPGTNTGSNQVGKGYRGGK